MDTAKIERVARAIRRAQLLSMGFGGATRDAEDDISLRVDSSWREFVPVAEAAINAIDAP